MVEPVATTLGLAELVDAFPEKEAMTILVRELEKQIKNISEQILATDRENGEIFVRANALDLKLADVSKECHKFLNHTRNKTLVNILNGGKPNKSALANFSKMRKNINNEMLSIGMEKPHSTEEPAPIPDDFEFIVARQVDSDGLLVAWKPSVKLVSEYKIFVNGELQQRLYPKADDSNRRKVLIQPINLNDPVSIRLDAVYEEGDTIRAATIQYSKCTHS